MAKASTLPTNLRDRVIEMRRVRAGDLRPHPLNWRVHPEHQSRALGILLRELGIAGALLAYQGAGGALVLIDGHLRQGGDPDTVWPVIVTDLNEEEAALLLATFDPLAGLAERDDAVMRELLQQTDGDLLAELLRENDALAALLGVGEDFAPAEPEAGGMDGETARKTLAERFGVPPFSVLDARQGYWQERKRAWLALGIESELGRGDNAFGESEGVNERHEHGTGNLGRKANAEPGGSPRDAASLGADGKTVRGDGKGRGLARKSGQDLMRGEHVVGKSDGNKLGFSAAATIRRGGVGFDGSKKYREEDGWQATGLTFASGSPRPDEVSLKLQEQASGTSIFDPVLCELAYRWFRPEGGAVLDPFAGGSVRGIVAAKLGRYYRGMDLSERQIAANEEQAAAICANGLKPVWTVGDSRRIGEEAPADYDFIFSCPPYADLEVYSDDPADLSTLDYPAFLAAYRQIIAACVSMLNPDRFACFCVGDVRDKRGFYRNFVSDTIAAFQDAGALLYNEAILVTAVGSLPIRVGKQFGSYRKLGKTHQNVVVFYKGDPKNIPAIAGDCEFGEVEIGDVPATDN